MKAWKITIVTVMLLSVMLVSPQLSKASETEGNDYPIIFVHGLGGWGPDEALGVNYWGGFKDLMAYLNSQGHHTLAAKFYTFLIC